MGLKIAIVSDLHCMPENLPRSNKTYLHTTTLGKPIVRHPVEAMKKLIKDQNLQADILLCPGDITDQANKQGYVNGWNHIEEISFALKVKNIYATMGNHDVDYKQEIPADAFKVAKELKANYPLPLPNQQAEFWGDSFCVVEEEDYRLFILNTVHDHFNTDSSKKINLTPHMLEKISTSLEKTDNSKIGIAMSHHHPISHYSSDFNDTDIIDKGDELLKILEKNNFNFYIHGHKHQPLLRDLSDVYILASGSFSCLENIKETESANMFHIVEINQDKCGIIRSWEYGLVNGWQFKNKGSFPILTGFGFRGNILDIAKDINDWLLSKEQPIGKLYSLVNDVNNILHLMPKQQQKLQDELIKQYGIEIKPDLTVGENSTINLQIL